jgi:hypothetical protein
VCTQIQWFSSRGTVIKNTESSLQTAKHVVWFNKIKRVKRVKRRYRTESGIDPPTKPTSYGIFKHFC